MKNCIRCNNELEPEINFCSSCGQDQRVNISAQNSQNASLLIVLCVMTIIGSLFTIGRAYLYEMVSMMDGSNDYFRGWIYAGSSIGTLIGALMMIQRKLNGLYVYSVSQVIYIVTVVIASFSYNDDFGGFGNEASILASGIAMFFLVPAIAFLIMYWTSMVRKHLR